MTHLWPRQIFSVSKL